MRNIGKIIEHNDEECVMFEVGKPYQYLFVGASGTQKSCGVEDIVCSEYKKGTTIIYLCDPKKIFEPAYHMFEPVEKWQIDAITKEGRKPEKIPIKIYHPFTFNLPKHKIPEMNIYTLSIKDLGDSEINFLLESFEDVISRNIILDVLSKLGDNDDLYDFFYKCGEQVSSKLEYLKGRLKPIEQRDGNGFWLKNSKKGKQSDLNKIQDKFLRFKECYYLQEKNCKYNLNYKELIKDNKHIHIFSTIYIGKDEKYEDFTTMFHYNKIVEANRDLKRPILIIMEELNNMCPRVTVKSFNYKNILAQSITIHLQKNNRGNNISSISTIQSSSSLIREIMKGSTFTKTFMGRQSSEDLKEISIVYGVSSKIRSQCGNLHDGEYLLFGFPEVNYNTIGSDDEAPTYKFLTPTTCHAEPRFKFIDFMNKYYPDKIVGYADIINEMKEKLKNSDKKYEELSKKEREAYIKRLKELDKIKEQKQIERDNIEKNKQSSSGDLKEKAKEEIWRLYKEGTSQRDIAMEITKKYYSITQPNVNYIINKMKKTKKIDELENVAKEQMGWKDNDAENQNV